MGTPPAPRKSLKEQMQGFANEVTTPKAPQAPITNSAPMFSNILTNELRARFDTPPAPKELYRVYALIIESGQPFTRIEIAQDLERHEAIGAIKAYKTLAILGNRKDNHIYMPAPQNDLFRQLDFNFTTKIMIFGELQ